jgi:multiple sugar transport system ATP-binding protein
MSLKLTNIRKKYADQDVLKGINIEIKTGEFLILVGGSGCGKSTLLNMIAGLETVTTGKIEIDGRVVNDLPPKDRDIAMVFQSYALYPSMTVRENIAFGLSLRKIAKDEQEKIVTRVSDMLQITHLLARKPGQLSGGQRQRVAMGRALARNPRLFLFDEPLSNLDAKLRVEMRAEIKRMHAKTGTTTVYVTHDQIEAMTLGDKIAVMRNGLVEQFGTPHEIYETPNNLYVAGFIGSPSMNFVKGMMTNEGFECGVTLPIKSAHRGEMILGLRPENITDKGEGHHLEVQIDLVEPTGPDTLVTFMLNSTPVVARVHPNAGAKLSEKISLNFDLTKAMLFDITTEKRLI